MSYRISRTLAALVVLAPLAGNAQPPPDTLALGLSGGRFPPLTWDQMNDAQRTMTQNVLNGKRASLGGPFNVLMRSPEMGDIAQKLGEYARFSPAMPPKLRELAIILTARHWTAQYEWYAHRQAAAREGLRDDVIKSIAARERPKNLDHDEQAVYDFATELLETKTVSDATFKRAHDLLGDQGVVDTIAVMGYYQMVSMLLNVDGHPLPAGVAPELK
ncbi:MAG TPA: carboxymuconolactone decarboxylase family protein [Gammaproteobacteria bacterium]|nr:carboxymuconolactone decarboxylase family protein [Gammaproteobacteria bacterium]